MGFLPGKSSPIAAILSVIALAVFMQPANGNSLLASTEYTNQTAGISGLRIGTHPDKTRIVLDLSDPTDLSYKVSSDGKTVQLTLPKATWQASSNPNRYIRGNIAGFNQKPGINSGSIVTLENKTPIRIKRPFFVSPSGNRGHRIVIDMVPSSMQAIRKSSSAMVASLDGTGALPKQKIEVAQVSRSNNPYIQRAFPQTGQPQQSQPRQTQPQANQPRMAPQMSPQMQHQTAPRQAQPMQQREGIFGLKDTYMRGALGFSVLPEMSSEGGSNSYDTEYQPGFNLSGALGTRLDQNMRLEAELMYTNASVKQISGTAVGSTFNTETVDGSISALNFMGNLAYDFPNNSRLTPFVMGGVGMAALFLTDHTAETTAIADDMDWVFALQLGFGASYDLDDRTKLEIGYRYFESQDPEFSDASGTPFESIFSSHSFLVGARIGL